jgi:hypothetical protein
MNHRRTAKMTLIAKLTIQIQAIETLTIIMMITRDMRSLADLRHVLESQSTTILSTQIINLTYPIIDLEVPIIRA